MVKAVRSLAAKTALAEGDKERITMKQLAIITALLTTAAYAGTLSWNDSNPPGTVKEYRIYSTTSLPLTNSPTALTNAANYTNWVLYATVPYPTKTFTTNWDDKVRFFSVRTANDWTESPFSVVNSSLRLISEPASLDISK